MQVKSFNRKSSTFEFINHANIPFTLLLYITQLNGLHERLQYNTPYPSILIYNTPVLLHLECFQVENFESLNFS